MKDGIGLASNRTKLFKVLSPVKQGNNRERDSVKIEK